MPMDEPIHTEVRHGYTLEIVPDYAGADFEADALKENTDVFLVGYHRDFHVTSPVIDEDTVRALFSEDEEDRGYHDVAEVEAQYHVFGLEAYIHSGVALDLAYEGQFPDRQWDVSQLGAVFVSKEIEMDRNEARKMAKTLIKTWNALLEGSVYGFIVRDKDGQVIESLGSFVETTYDIEKTEVLNEARDMADYLYSRALKRHTQRRKAQIERRVPVDKRLPLTAGA